MSKKHVIHIGFHPACAEYLDFDQYNISIVIHPKIDEGISDELRKELSGIGVIDVPHNMNLNEYDLAFDKIEDQVEKLINQIGEPFAFVGMFEHVTFPAAKLREKYGLKGTSSRTAYLCRDKVEMKKVLGLSGILIPKNFPISNNVAEKDLIAMVNQIPGKIVLKPRKQAASEGVFIFDDKEGLINHYKENGFDEDYQMEEFIDGDILHFDGVVRNGKLLFISGATYLNTCFDYATNCADLGAVTIDNLDLMSRAKELTIKIASSLELHNSVFHLELFRTSNDRLVFLEIGNRFGGAGVSALIKLIYGVKLVTESINSDIGAPSEITKEIDTTKDIGAWLYTAYSTKEKAEIIEVCGADLLPQSIVYSEVAKVGKIINDEITVFGSSGKFFFKGKNSEEIKKDCESLMNSYEVRLKKLS